MKRSKSCPELLEANSKENDIKEVFTCLRNINREYFENAAHSDGPTDDRSSERVIRARSRELLRRKTQLEKLLRRVSNERSAYEMAKMGLAIRRENRQKQYENKRRLPAGCSVREPSWCQMQ